MVARALPPDVPLRLRAGAAPRPAGVARADELARAPAAAPDFWPDFGLGFWPGFGLGF
ncbi:hypothetical protein LJR027_002581 [Terrabacter sp. LjRoot27]|uniref:hypothetical protein n=1 Tax=Terrabacter sp. LjRoot27 TaxID=3342306 RepID=UPI003ECF0D45